MTKSAASFEKFVISFEGLDGCGKTTQVQLLVEYLEGKDMKVEVLKQPPIDGISNKLQDELLEECLIDVRRSDDEKHLLYVAQALTTEYSYEGGGILILDRGPHSMLAYSSAMTFKRKGFIDALNLMTASSLVWPDITFFLNGPLELLMSRQSGDGRYEQMPKERQQLIQDAYLEIVTRYGKCRCLDAWWSVEDLHSIIIRDVQDCWARYGSCRSWCFV